MHYNAQVKWLQEDFSRQVVSVEVINESLDLLDKILEHPSEYILLLLDMYAHASKAHEERNYGFSLIICWTIAEKLLQELWKRFIDDQKKVQIETDGKKIPIIDAERKKLLEDGRSFTSSVIAEILTFREIISFPTYKIISKVRKTRNAWIHGLRNVTREQGHEAIELVRRMLSEVEGIDLPVLVVDRYHWNLKSDLS